MIVQETGGGLLLFRQTDHALLSGAFAAKWGSGALPHPPRADATVVAAARHDDGWADWELAPKVDAEGHPLDFIRIPVDEHVALYRHGIDLVCREDPFAGLVVSLHGERLYTRPFMPGLDPRISRLEGRELQLAEGYVDGERSRQSELLRDLGEDAPDEAEEAWRLLQVWDRMSLFVCMQPLEAAGEYTMPPVRGADGTDVRLTLWAEPPDAVVCDPYPFSEKPETFGIEAFAVEGRRWEDDAAFRRAFRASERRMLRFEVRSG